MYVGKFHDGRGERAGERGAVKGSVNSNVVLTLLFCLGGLLRMARKL